MTEQVAAPRTDDALRIRSRLGILERQMDAWLQISQYKKELTDVERAVIDREHSRAVNDGRAVGGSDQDIALQIYYRLQSDHQGLKETLQRMESSPDGEAARGEEASRETIERARMMAAAAVEEAELRISVLEQQRADQCLSYYGRPGGDPSAVALHWDGISKTEELIAAERLRAERARLAITEAERRD